MSHSQLEIVYERFPAGREYGSLRKCKHFPIQVHNRSCLPLVGKYDQPQAIQTRVGNVCSSQSIPPIYRSAQIDANHTVMQEKVCTIQYNVYMLSTPNCGGVALAQSSLSLYQRSAC